MQSHVAGSLCHKTQKKGGREVMPGGQREQGQCSRLSTGRQRLLGPRPGRQGQISPAGIET